MIRPLTEILQFKPKAGADDIGALIDLYLGDRHWHVRYFLAHASSWLRDEHEVLLHITALEGVSRAEKTIIFNVTRDQIARCPSCGVARPVCANLVSTLHDHYGWPRYWDEDQTLVGPLLCRASWQMPATCAPSPTGDEGSASSPCLMSGRDLLRYRVLSDNQPIGEIRDLLIDLGEWTVRYVVVQLQDDSKQVLLSPHLINRVDGETKSVAVDFSEQMVRHSPCYHRCAPIMMTYDDGVSDYYYFPAKWLLNHNPNQLVSFNDYQLFKK